jgi:hypothetical protein
VLLLLALVVDYMSVGPNSIRDRLAFLMGLVAVREGFNGSPLDDFVAQQLDKRPTMDVVREAKRRYGKSQATVMRAIRKARGGRGAKP